MLGALQFVRGAVSTKTFEPVLKHFRIQGGRVQSYNGVLSLSSPIDCNLDVKPLASPFVKAIQLCEEAVSLHLTETGRLAIRSGKFKAFIDCSGEDFPDIEPSGKRLELSSELLEALAFLAPIMGTDASRLWSHGILLANRSAYVTNNIVLVEKWLGKPLPAVLGLPSLCVKEMLRIGEEPTDVQSDGKTVTFHYSDDRWLTSALLNVAQWPNPEQFFVENNDPGAIDDSLFEAIEKVRPFTGELHRVWLHEDGTVSTSNTEEEGAHLQLTSCTGMSGCYSADQLLRLRGVATSIDWSKYPRPCQFYGEGIRGVIIGLAE